MNHITFVLFKNLPCGKARLPTNCAETSVLMAAPRTYLYEVVKCYNTFKLGNRTCFTTYAAADSDGTEDALGTESAKDDLSLEAVFLKRWLEDEGTR